MKIIRYTEQELKFIEDNYQTMGNVAMGEALGRPADGIKHQMFRFGWRRTPEQVTALKQAPNAGHYTTGHKPHNTKFDGHERIDDEGYTWMRVQEGEYKLKHRVIFENHFGKLRPGYNVIFKDGDRTNFSPDNFEEISNAELALRNHNREKAAESLKRTWSRYFYLDQMGIKRGWYRNKSA